MADDIALPATSGTVAADEISSVKYQRVKLIHGADGVNAGDVATTNPFPVNDYDTELNLVGGRTGLRDNLVAQRYTVLADSLADGLATFWTSTTANGGTTTSSGGEGLVQTSANATGSAQLSGTAVTYLPGQVAWFNSAVRFNDTGSAGNIRRIGVFTVSGTTPQNGFYYELSGTTVNAVYVNAGTPTAVASTSWSKFSTAPFTLDTNFHFFEIRFTGNTVWFYIDNVLRHQISGTSAAITATLNFPMTIQSINTSGATNRLIAVRNCGYGRFGSPASLLTKGTQESFGLTVQELKDAGRTHVMYSAVAVAAGTTTTETAITLVKSSGTAATSSAASHTPASGKRFRITSITFATRGNATATIQTTTFNFRINTAGAVTTSSTPILFSVRSATPATASAWDRFQVPIPDGFEIVGDGTLQFGVTAAATYTTNAPTWDVLITGFEF